MNRSDIAKAIEPPMSVGHLSDILNGKTPPGKDISKRFEQFTGRKWTEFMDMTPSGIEAALSDAADRKAAQ